MSKPTSPTQLERVRSFVAVHGPSGFTLAGMAFSLGIAQTAASARLRDLRREGYTVTPKTFRDANGKQQVTYTTSQTAVNPARIAKGPKVATPPPKDTGIGALTDVAHKALIAAGYPSGVLGGRETVVNAIAKYLAA